MESGRTQNIRYWLLASRPRTLILGISSVGMGLFLAAADSKIDPLTSGLTMITATLLQILSNLANDYGDWMHGADHGQRSGPSRAVQSGQISAQSMRRAIIVIAASSAICGMSLLWLALGIDGLIVMAIFVLVGALAIWAAVAYTAGSVPYGYVGLGDFAVLVFFGWVAVAGSYFLQAHDIRAAILLPATSCGLFAVGVLNVNNIRDIESDRIAGKQSVPVRLGLKWARRYHWGLLFVGVILALIYVVVDYRVVGQLLFLVSLPAFVRNGLAVSRRPPAELDPYLRQLSISTLLFVLLFGLGQLLAS